MRLCYLIVWTILHIRFKLHLVTFISISVSMLVLWFSIRIFPIVSIKITAVIALTSIRSFINLHITIIIRALKDAARFSIHLRWHFGIQNILSRYTLLFLGHVKSPHILLNISVIEPWISTGTWFHIRILKGTLADLLILIAKSSLISLILPITLVLLTLFGLVLQNIFIGSSLIINITIYVTI